MNVVTNDDEFLDRDIKYIYYCKSFLQVRCVSDLCNANGTYVLPNIEQGFCNIQQFQFKYKEIIQELPYEKIWTVWQRFLCTHICNNKWKLRMSLGPWKISYESSNRLWPFFYSHKKSILYQSYQL